MHNILCSTDSAGYSPTTGVADMKGSKGSRCSTGSTNSKGVKGSPGSTDSKGFTGSKGFTDFTVVNMSTVSTYFTGSILLALLVI